MILRTSHRLGVSAALACLLLISGSALGQAASAGGASHTVSPFAPLPPGGGQYTPPSDQGVPNDGSGGTTTTGGTSQGAPAQASGPAVSGGRSVQGSIGTRASSSSGADLGLFLDQRDSWVQWWETNKFDFIQLRRIRDTPVTGQGRIEETEAERNERLAVTDHVVRADVIPVLRKLTGAGDPAVRASAVVALAKLQDEEGATLARALLKDRSFDVRRASMLAMGVLDAGRSSYFLMNIADDSALGRSLLNTSRISDEDRGIALLTSALRGHRAPEILVDRLLRDADDLPNEVLASACDAAGLMRSVEAISKLTAVALDTGRPEFVRASAATALGRLEDPGAIPALLEILDSALEPRRAAVVALGLVGHRGQPAIVQRLSDLLDDTDGPTRHFAAISLGRIGGEQACATLLAAARNPRSDMRAWLALGLGLCARQDPAGEIPLLLMDRYERESNADTAGAYLIALGLCGRNRTGDYEASLPWDRMLGTLEAALNGKRTQLAAHAALALGLTGHPDAGTVLSKALESTSSPDIQRQVALGLGVLGNSSSIPNLLKLMRETNNPFVASFAALGVAFMGDADAIGPLMHMIDHAGPNGVTTTYAVAAVGQLLDSDRRPALSRLAAGDNYLARTSSVRHLLALGF